MQLNFVTPNRGKQVIGVLEADLWRRSFDFLFRIIDFDSSERRSDKLPSEFDKALSFRLPRRASYCSPRSSRYSESFPRGRPNVPLRRLDDDLVAIA